MAVGPSTGFVTLFDDFEGDVIMDQWQSTADGTGSVAVDAAGIDGLVLITTGGVDNEMSELGRALQWRVSDGTLVMETRINIDDPTLVAFNAGFNDDPLEDSNTLPVELSGTTFTSNAGTFIGYVFDTDATNDTIHVFWVDANSDTPVAIADLNTGIVPVAGEFLVLKIELFFQSTGQLARVRFNIQNETDQQDLFDVTFPRSFVQGDPGSITATTPLTPYIAAENRSASSRVLTADYVMAMKSRADS